MTNTVVEAKTATRFKIVRALLCAAGQHEAWVQDDVWAYRTPRVVYVSVESKMHGDVNCAICKHCRTLYVRRAAE